MKKIIGQNRDMAVVKRPKRWFNGGFVINQEFRAECKILGAVGAAGTALKWAQHASHDDRILALQEALRLASIKYRDENNMHPVQATAEINNYLSELIDPSVVTLVARHEIINIMPQTSND